MPPLPERPNPEPQLVHFSDRLPLLSEGSQYILANASACRAGFEVAAQYADFTAEGHDPLKFFEATRVGWRACRIVKSNDPHHKTEFEAMVPKMIEADVYLRGITVPLGMALESARGAGAYAEALQILYALAETNMQCARLSYGNLMITVDHVWAAPAQRRISANEDAVQQLRSLGTKIFSILYEAVNYLHRPGFTVTAYNLLANYVSEMFGKHYPLLRTLDVYGASMAEGYEMVSILAAESNDLRAAEKELLERLPSEPPSVVSVEAPDPALLLLAERDDVFAGHQAWLNESGFAVRFSSAFSKKDIEELGLRELETRLKKTVYRANARRLVEILHGFAACELDETTQRDCGELFARDLACRQHVTLLDERLRRPGQPETGARASGTFWLSDFADLLRSESARSVIVPLVQEYWPGDGDELLAKIELLTEPLAIADLLAHLGAAVVADPSDSAEDVTPENS